MTPNFTEQLMEVTKVYGSMSRSRVDTASYCKLILHLDEAVITAALNEIERQLNVVPQATVAPAVAEPPVWETPAHEEIPLHELDPEAPGLDPLFNDDDAKFVDAIYAAKRKKSALGAEPGPASRFRLIAESAIARGEQRILPIEVGGKNPAIKWAASKDNIANDVDTRIDTFTTDEWASVVSDWVNGLAVRFPELNACVIAKPDELVFIDCDTTHEFVTAYEAFAGEKFPVTYTTSARENRTQMHFRQTDATRKLRNVPQFAIDGIDFSVRQHNLYVLAEGSQHPSGSMYVQVVDADIAVMPDKLVAFIEHLKMKTRQTSSDVGENTAATFPEKVVYQRNAGGLIERGRHNATLQRVGEMHANKEYLTLEDRLEAIRDWRDTNIVNPDNDSEYNDKKLRAMVRDSFGWEDSGKLLLDQTVVAPQPVTSVEEPIELDRSEGAMRPKFPLWALNGTSLYENLVKPACATSSKFEEFIFLPAMQTVMNYLSGKVTIELQPTNMNFFLGLISPYGEFFKSTSAKLAHKYCHLAGLCAETTHNMTNAGALTLITQAGSPEGFGILMKRLNCKHAIMFNDELGKFAAKAGIDSSAFSHDMLTWYGSEYFSNTVTASKNNFAFENGTYTFGWLWCTTDRNFNRYWPKLAGISSGIGDRMFFAISQEKPRPSVPYTDPSAETMIEGAKKTRILIDKAVEKRTYRIEEYESYVKRAKGLDPRSLDLLKKLSLYFAIDLGIDVIDDDCMERARALVDYRNQADAFLEPIEADNIEGRLQKEIMRELRQNRGLMTYRDLCHDLDYSRYGSKLWKSSYYGLVNHGDILDFHEARTEGKRKTHMVGLVKHHEDE